MILDAMKNCDSTKIGVVFKTVTIILCFIGFVFQIQCFIVAYYSYPTVLNIDVQKPDVFLKPAVTVCSNNLVKRSLFCSKYPRKCETHENLKDLCKERPYYCNKRNMSDFKMPKDEEFEFHYRNLMTVEDWTTLPPQHHEFIHKEIFYWEEKFEGPFYFGSFRIPTNNYTFFEQFSCFTINSRIISGKEALYIPFDKIPFKEFNRQEANKICIGSFELNAEEDEQIDDYEPRAFISVHSPLNFDNPLETLVPLETGKKYEIFIRLEKETYQPYPYKTDCIDYEEIWRNKNRTSPRSKQVCLRACADQLERRCKNCSDAPWESLKNRCIQQKVTKCFRSRINIDLRRLQIRFADIAILQKKSPSLVMIDKNMCEEIEIEKEMQKVNICKSNCKNECTIYKYPFKVVGRNHKSTKWRDKYGRHLIRVNMHIDEPEILVYQHIPKYIYVELFSNIGGIFGIWLGLSIWSTSYAVFKFPIIFFQVCLGKLNNMRNSL